MIGRLLTAMLCAMLAASACRPIARVQHSDGTVSQGALMHMDDDIVVLRKVRRTAPMTMAAPWSDRNGMPVWRTRAQELAIPQLDIVHLEAENRRAKTAGIVGSVIAGVGLIIVAVSADALADCEGPNPDFSFCVTEQVGVTAGAFLSVGGLLTGIIGFAVWESSRLEGRGGASGPVAKKPPLGAITF